jgi:DNA-binding Lrp family transcriptional regulator
MLGKSEEQVAQEIAQLEKDGIIKGFTAIIDESAYDPNSVFALIELKVTPQSQSGFDEIAQQISSFDQVEAVRLMSGTYDIIVEVTGKNIRDISLFVSQRLAAIDAVQETTTHFGLRVYKDNGIIIGGEEKDERGMF